MAGLSGAKATITSTDIAHNHKSSSASGPTLRFVRTASAAANCMQIMLSNYAIYLRKSRALVESYL